MNSTFKKLLPYALLLLLPVVWIVGEVRYAHRINPEGVRTLSEHFQRIGSPQRIYKVQRADGTFYYLSGFPDGHPPRLALPSSPPAYIYDHSGNFVDWCPDPGDRCPGWFDRWPTDSKAALDINAFRQQFSL